MLLEVPFAMVAWVSVVLIQAIVHFGMFGARREPALQPAAGEEVDNYQLDEDEDPPEGLETLLSQTGDDVISIIRSNSFIENRARKELDREKED